MSSPHCQRITSHVTDLVADESFAARFRELAAREHTAQEVTDLLCDHLPFEVAAELRGEYLALPRIMADLIVESWRMADAAGKPWAFQSVLPPEPISFARNRKVRFVIDVDQDSVTLGVSHVAGRKSPWYQPVAETVS